MIFPDIYDYGGSCVHVGDAPSRETPPERVPFVCLGVPYTAHFFDSSPDGREAFFRSLSRTETRKEDVRIEEVLLLLRSLFPESADTDLLPELGQVYVKREQLELVLLRIAQLSGDRRDTRLSFMKSRYGLTVRIVFPELLFEDPLSEERVASLLSSDRFTFRYLLALALAGGFDLSLESVEGRLSFRVFLPFRSADSGLYADPSAQEKEDEFLEGPFLH